MECEHFYSPLFLPSFRPFPFLGVDFAAAAFDYLDAPAMRVTGADLPTPYAKNLEDHVFPRANNVIRSVKHLLNVK
jgi:pyruvate/2-oxoglutarate/acetoin dehydrogenase E1 component